MTGDELAARLFVEQGYLVMGSLTPADIGEIDDYSLAVSQGRTPLRIVGLSNASEYYSQADLAHSLAPHLSGKSGGPVYRYFYRVEAAD